jgi:hypothetical protein
MGSLDRIRSSYHGRWFFGAVGRAPFVAGGPWALVVAIAVGGVVAFLAAPTGPDAVTVGIEALFRGLIATLAVLGALVIVQLVLTPRRMEQENEATHLSKLSGIENERDAALRSVEEMRRPLETIRLFNAHIETGRPLGRRMVGVRRPPNQAQMTDDEYVSGLIEIRDWLRSGLDLVERHSPGRRQEYLVVWRSVPTAIRNMKGDEAESVPRRHDASVWVSRASDVLRDCIRWLELQARG